MYYSCMHADVNCRQMETPDKVGCPKSEILLRLLLLLFLLLLLLTATE